VNGRGDGARGEGPGVSVRARTKVHRELNVPPDTHFLSQVRQAVLDVLGKDLFSPVKANMIALAVDEAVANIMEHGGNNPGCEIQVVLDVNPERFEVRIRDSGEGFDPNAAPEVNIREHVKAGRKGGLGIFLMRRIMDEVNYTFKQGVHNELQMVKYIDAAKAKNKSKVAG